MYSNHSRSKYVDLTTYLHDSFIKFSSEFQFCKGLLASWHHLIEKDTKWVDIHLQEMINYNMKILNMSKGLLASWHHLIEKDTKGVDIHLQEMIKHYMKIL